MTPIALVQNHNKNTKASTEQASSPRVRPVSSISSNVCTIHREFAAVATHQLAACYPNCYTQEDHASSRGQFSRGKTNTPLTNFDSSHTRRSRCRADFEAGLVELQIIHELLCCWGVNKKQLGSVVHNLPEGRKADIQQLELTHAPRLDACNIPHAASNVRVL